MVRSVPDGDLATVIEAAVSAQIERLEARCLAAAKTPRTTVAQSDTRPGSRHIPAAVVRAVRERDGDRCAFVDGEGRRCSERRHLEFHHRHPHGFGGDRSPGNISLRCRAHNRYEAEQDFGRGRLEPRRLDPAPRTRPATDSGTTAAPP
jgi:5-methylcytosine-specific restriction endonuclease McrA